MTDIESKLISNFAEYFLAEVIETVIHTLDQVPSVLMKPGYKTKLNSYWEEISAQTQSDNIDEWDAYEQQIRDCCLEELEKEKPALVNMIAYFICSDMNIIFEPDTDYNDIIVDWIFPDFIERAENENRPSILQFVTESKTIHNKITSFRAQFESEAIDLAKKIINQIEEGAGKFEMPWHKGLPFALNRYTGNMYSGMNQLRLWDACQNNKYSRNYWATFYQWRKLGGNIITGSRSTKIGVVFERKIANDPNQLPIPDMAAAPFKLKKYLRFFSVFNMDQVADHNFDKPDLFTPDQNSLEAIKNFIDKTKAIIKVGGELAFYKSSEDFIQMPHMVRFKDGKYRDYREAYYAVLLHELIHWTGHHSRCCRNNNNPDKKIRYAFEELVAELGSAMLCSYFNKDVYPRAEHAQYIESWLGVLKKDFSYFYQAQNQAITAINWLFVHTEFLPFEIKKRPVFPISDDRFDNWETLYNLSNQEVYTEFFTQSII
jgi:antirestriction protein ArdC